MWWVVRCFYPWHVCKTLCSEVVTFCFELCVHWCFLFSIQYHTSTFANLPLEFWNCCSAALFCSRTLRSLKPSLVPIADSLCEHRPKNIPVYIHYLFYLCNLKLDFFNWFGFFFFSPLELDLLIRLSCRSMNSLSLTHTHLHSRVCLPGTLPTGWNTYSYCSSQCISFEVFCNNCILV